MISLGVTNGFLSFSRSFSSTEALRQTVMSKGDEYSDYERSILKEINMLRGDPVGYSAIVEAEATVGYPFVRDDPVPAQCSEMTLLQLRVYIDDFKRERAELKESLQKMQREFVEADANMKLRWSVEDAERAKKGRRGVSGVRKVRGFLKEDDYLLERQRAAQQLQDDHTRRVNETKLRLSQVERSCRWAIDGANTIIKCVQKLREAQAVPVLQCNRGLALAARDVGNECHSALSTSKLYTSGTPPHASLVLSSSLNCNANIDNELSRPQQSYNSEICGNDSGGDEGGLTTHKPSLKSQIQSSSEWPMSDVCDQVSLNDNSFFSTKRDAAPDVSLVNIYCKEQGFFGGNSAQPTLSLHEDFGENDLLKKAMHTACSRYGYYSGAVRGVQICGVFAPRKLLIQMLLGSRVVQATLLAPTATHETCGLLSFPLLKETKNLLMWASGRLLGCGCVCAQDGVVSVTVIIANSFEELNIIRQSHEFSLPQIHRVLNSAVVGSTGQKSIKQTVLDINSFLGVKVVEPVAHPIFLDSNERVVRLIISADPQVVELSAAVTSATDPIPSVPLLDFEILFVQHRINNIAEVEILIDAYVARCRWSGRAILVHLFERNRSSATVGSFNNIGFIRVIPVRCASDNTAAVVKQHSALAVVQTDAEATMFRPPHVLGRQQWRRAIEVKGESHGWPVVTVEFQRRCASIIEPLNGTWFSYGDRQHVAIQIPDYNYLQAFIDNILGLVEKERKYFEWGCGVKTEKVAKEVIISTQEKLDRAEKELQERGCSLEQELAQVEKNMAKRRGKELTKLEKQEKEIRQQLSALKDEVKDLKYELAAAKEDLVQLGREHTLRLIRQQKFLNDYEQVCEYADRTRPLCVKVTLFPENPVLSASVETTQLYPTNEANTLYEANVPLVSGFKGRAVLFVNNQEAVQWEVRPGF